jgi:hypothetical protein
MQRHHSERLIENQLARMGHFAHLATSFFIGFKKGNNLEAGFTGAAKGLTHIAQLPPNENLTGEIVEIVHVLASTFQSSKS